MVSAEGGSVPSGVGYGEGCPLSSRLGAWGSVVGSVVSSPAGSWAEPRPKNGFGRILKATESSFLYLYDKIRGGTICISVPRSKFRGGLVPPCPLPVIYAHAYTPRVVCE